MIVHLIQQLDKHHKFFRVGFIELICQVFLSLEVIFGVLLLQRTIVFVAGLLVNLNVSI